MLTFDCPKCHAKLFFEQIAPGAQVKCTACNEIVRAPEVTELLAAPPPLLAQKPPKRFTKLQIVASVVGAIFGLLALDYLTGNGPYQAGYYSLMSSWIHNNFGPLWDGNHAEGAVWLSVSLFFWLLVPLDGYLRPGISRPPATSTVATASGTAHRKAMTAASVVGAVFGTIALFGVGKHGIGFFGAGCAGAATYGLCRAGIALWRGLPSPAAVPVSPLTKNSADFSIAAPLVALAITVVFHAQIHSVPWVRLTIILASLLLSLSGCVLGVIALIAVKRHGRQSFFVRAIAGTCLSALMSLIILGGLLLTTALQK